MKKLTTEQYIFLNKVNAVYQWMIDNSVGEGDDRIIPTGELLEKYNVANIVGISHFVNLNTSEVISFVEGVYNNGEYNELEGHICNRLGILYKTLLPEVLEYIYR